MRFSLRPKLTLDAVLIERLVSLGKKALDSNDVPIAALLLSNGEVIGEGFNTVLRDGNAGGHAEINAISSAIHIARDGTVPISGPVFVDARFNIRTVSDVCRSDREL
jgi:tRNA(Arg) A34 adenosine deaminase TadA